MTLKEEIALAILLWKYWRQMANGNRNPQDLRNVRDGGAVEYGFEALEMAKAAGVKDEFISMLTEFPSMTVTVQEYEKWDPHLASKLGLKKPSPSTQSRKRKSVRKNEL